MRTQSTFKSLLSLVFVMFMGFNMVAGGNPTSSKSDFKLVEECKQQLGLVPNIITPNNDGNNDEFLIKSNTFTSITSIQIFGRDGHLVYQSDSESNRWDGTFNGQDLSSGVYIVKYQVQCVNGAEFENFSNVTLIR